MEPLVSSKAPISLQIKSMRPYHIHPGDTDETKLFTLQTASCLGNCGAAPMALVGEDTYGTIDPEKSIELLSAYKLEDEPEQQSEEAASE